MLLTAFILARAIANPTTIAAAPTPVLTSSLFPSSGSLSMSCSIPQATPSSCNLQPTASLLFALSRGALLSKIPALRRLPFGLAPPFHNEEVLSILQIFERAPPNSCYAVSRDILAMSLP
ncbi:hypothetical protein NL676_005454 [Syzygium grande]|nr:hypothetical protein NL676_005454 [Syzygium grande]